MATPSPLQSTSPESVRNISGTLAKFWVQRGVVGYVGTRYLARGYMYVYPTLGYGYPCYLVMKKPKGHFPTFVDGIPGKLIGID